MDQLASCVALPLPAAICHAGRDVAHEHRARAVDHLTCEFVEGLLSAVADLGVDRLDQPRLATPLCLGELLLHVAVKPCLLQLRAVRALGRILWPRSKPTTAVRSVEARSTLQTMLQYQRPRASWEKLPDLNWPWISRCFHSRILRPRTIAIEPLISTSWFVNGVQPSERRAPRLTRHWSFGRPACFRLSTNSSMTSWITWEGKPSSLLAPFVRSRSCFFVAYFGPRRADLSLISLQ